MTPVVTVHISMGGDNHSDSNLQAESDQHVSGITAMNKLLMNDTANGVLASLGLLDQVTFANWNVFGRNLAGISKVTSRTGRDHWGNHNVSVMVGKNFKSSVIGGVAADSGNDGGYSASDIDSASGRGDARAGDIPAGADHGRRGQDARRGARHSGQRPDGRLDRLGRRQDRHRRAHRRPHDRLTSYAPTSSASNRAGGAPRPLGSSLIGEDEKTPAA